MLLSFLLLFVFIDRRLRDDFLSTSNGSTATTLSDLEDAGDATSGAYSFLWKRFNHSKKLIEPDTRPMHVLVTGAAGFGTCCVVLSVLCCIIFVFVANFTDFETLL